MWQNFFGAGGFGMYPTSFFGFLLVAAAVLFAVRPLDRFARLVVVLMGLTFSAGLLGSTVGICNACHYISQVPAAEQLQTLALGCEESLHNLVLALILMVVAGILTGVGLLRAQTAGARSGGA